MVFQAIKGTGLLAMKKIKIDDEETKEFLKNYREIINTSPNIDINYFYYRCIHAINDGKNTHPLNWFTMLGNPNTQLYKIAKEHNPHIDGFNQLKNDSIKKKLLNKPFKYVVFDNFYKNKKFINDDLAVIDFYLAYEKYKESNHDFYYVTYQGNLTFKDKKFWMTGFHGGIKVPLDYCWITSALDS
jgi:hypothetical protein